MTHPKNVGLLSALLITPLLLGLREEGDTKRSQVPQRDRVSPPTIELTLLDTAKQIVFHLQFKQDAAPPAGYSDPNGVWLRAEWRATDFSRKEVARKMRVVLRVAARRAPERISQIDGQTVALFTGGTVDLVQLSGVRQSACQTAVIVGFDAKFTATARLGGDWDPALALGTTGAILADLCDQLTAKDSRAEPCEPTMQTCMDAARDRCTPNGGVCIFSYTCDRSTGLAVCSFTCCKAVPG